MTSSSSSSSGAVLTPAAGALDDYVLSLVEGRRRESRKRNTKKQEKKDRERADFAHTIDFSSLRTASTHTSTTATSASVVAPFGEPKTLAAPSSELYQSTDTTRSTKPTRKGLRKGSLSRSLKKIFQERTFLPSSVVYVHVCNFIEE